MNPVQIEEAVSALASEPFPAAEFPYKFLLAFGNASLRPIVIGRA